MTSGRTAVAQIRPAACARHHQLLRLALRSRVVRALGQRPERRRLRRSSSPSRDSARRTVHGDAAQVQRVARRLARAAAIALRVPSTFGRRNASQPPRRRDRRRGVEDRRRIRAAARDERVARRARRRARISTPRVARAQRDWRCARARARAIRRAASRSTMCEPTSPVAPVTSARGTSALRGKGSAATSTRCSPCSHFAVERRARARPRAAPSRSRCRPAAATTPRFARRRRDCRRRR